MLDHFDKPDDYPETGSWDETTQAGQLADVIAEKPADVDEEQVQPDVVKEIYIPEQGTVTFTYTRKQSAPPPEGVDPNIAFIRENPNTIHKVLERCDDLLQALQSGKLAATNKDANWMASLISGLQHTSLEKLPYKALERAGSHWRDGITIPGRQNLERIGNPKQVYTRGKRMSREEQLAYLSSLSGGGGTFEAFLPRSGMWIRMRQPDADEITTLQTELHALKVKLGAETKGAAFSHADFIMLDLVTNLALKCVIASNRSYLTPSDLEHGIALQDETILHHALASIMFPAGFPYSVPCIGDPDKCNNVFNYKLNMANIVHFDDEVFTPSQREFIGKRFEQATEEDFAKYRESFTIGNPKVIWLDNGGKNTPRIGLRIAEPSVAERRRSGKEWYDGLLEMSSGVFNEPPHGTNRIAYMIKQSEDTAATQYAHWIEAIYVEDTEALELEDQLFTDDHDTIVRFLKARMSKPDNLKQIIDAIHQFNADSIIGIVGLESHNCPNCSTEQGEAFHTRLPHIVPLDMTSTFFTLADQMESV